MARTGKTAASAAGLLAGAGLAAIAFAQQDAAEDPFANFTPVTDEMLLDPAPGDWLMWRRTLDSWGYSPLDEVNRRNVDRLQLVWTRPLPEGGDQEGTPLVHDGIMFFPAPSDMTYAFDAATGDLLWEHKREWPEDLNQYIPVPGLNRNLAIYGDVVVDLSSDDFLYALDVRTGDQRWEVQVNDYKGGSQHSSGPIAANGKIFATGGCEPEGGPEACVVTAHDATTGRELWRRRTIAGPGDPGDASWGGVADERRVHAGAWMAPSYDPELDLLYVGTSVTAPAPKFMLGGNDLQHLYHNSTLAIDAETGEIRWHYQHLIDHWDLDHPFERLLVDTEVAPDPDEVIWINPNLRPGEERRVVTGIPGKTGIVYTLDRETGEFLWARPTVNQNVVANIDGATGAVAVNPETLFNADGDQVTACPSATGGKNWPAGAYSPDTGLMYFPLLESCMTLIAVTPELDDAGVPDGPALYGVRNGRGGPPNDPNQMVGNIYAVSASTGDTAWEYEQRAPTLSLVATGGGLVFGGDATGRFRAFNDRTGEVLWEVNLGSPVAGYPATFEVDGKQYVAVSTGTQLRSASLTPELRIGGTNNLFVFALP
jgi:alcohol dehydrogenase (cytochrome c)